MKLVVSRQGDTISFTGSGTYQAREQIKSLGRARWNPEKQSWDVSGFSGSDEHLKILFSEFSIEFNGKSSHQNNAVKKQDIEFKSEGIPPNALSVSQLVGKVKAAIRTAFPSVVPLYGLIVKINPSPKGYVFIELSEIHSHDETISCLVPGDVFQKIEKLLQSKGLILEVDLQVMFLVSVDINTKRASLQLRVQDIVLEYTLSKIQALRDQTNEKLKKEGIFEKNKLLPFPLLPKKITVLTSAVGTVIFDFLSAIESAHFSFEISLIHVPVQGKDARDFLVSKILSIKDADCLVLIRGGGSAGDLSIFNDYEVAKAICLAKVPVLSAIGHTEDQSSSQDVSYMAFGVPKELGLFLSSKILSYRKEFYEAVQRILPAVKNTVHQHSQSLKAFESNLSHLLIKIRNQSQNIEMLARNVAMSIQQKIKRSVESISLAAMIPVLGEKILNHRRSEMKILSQQLLYKVREKHQKYKPMVENIEIRIEEASPEKQLARGYAIIRREGQVITRRDQIVVSQRVEIEQFDGTFQALVELKK